MSLLDPSSRALVGVLVSGSWLCAACAAPNPATPPKIEGASPGEEALLFGGVASLDAGVEETPDAGSVAARADAGRPAEEGSRPPCLSVTLHECAPVPGRCIPLPLRRTCAPKPER